MESEFTSQKIDVFLVKNFKNYLVENSDQFRSTFLINC